MRRLARTVTSIAVWMLVVVCVGLLLAVGLGPRTGRYRTLTVLSGSMRPGIPIGAVVVVTPEQPDQLRVGQIITYRIPIDDHHVVSHRVVKILEGGARPVFQTKGDANDSPDPWIAQVNGGETLWRVRFVVPGLGRTLQWLRGPVVHTVAVLVLPAVVAVWWIIGIWLTDDDKDDEPSEPSEPSEPEPAPAPLVGAGRTAAEGGR